jgi:hypothetical protein
MLKPTTTAMPRMPIRIIGKIILFFMILTPVWIVNIDLIVEQFISRLGLCQVLPAHKPIPKLSGESSINMEKSQETKTLP